LAVAISQCPEFIGIYNANIVIIFKPFVPKITE
jgi:hypothetical protein